MTTSPKRNAGQLLLDVTQESNKVAGQVWQTSGNLISTNKEAVVACADADEIRSLIMDLWTRDVDKEVPETGKNQKGEDVILRHDGSKKKFPKGQIKFRAWDVTAQTAKGLSTIAGAIGAVGYDKVFPKGNLVGKTACEELAKSGKASEPAVKAIKRGLALIEQNITGLTDIGEINELDALFNSTLMAYNTHVAPIKSATNAHTAVG